MKLLIFSSIILLISSCEKRTEYNCICTGGWDDTHTVTIVKSASYNRADAKCREKGSGVNVDDGITCELEK